jgi:hypothetical protein
VLSVAGAPLRRLPNDIVLSTQAALKSAFEDPFDVSGDYRRGLFALLV